MIAVFPKVEEFLAYRTKKRLKTAFVIATCLYAAIEIFLVVFDIVRVNTYHDRSLYVPFALISAFLTVLYGWSAIVFLSVKYKRTKDYAQMFTDFHTGLKDEDEGIFTGYDDTLRVKDGLTFYVMKVKCKAKSKRFEDADREVLMYVESPKIEMEVGQKIKILTHSNILIAFELIEPPQRAERSTPDA